MRRAGILLFLLVALSSARAGEVRFAVIGDTQGTDNGDSINRVVLARMVDEILELDPAIEFVVIVGDLVTGYCDGDTLLNQWRDWREITDPWYRSEMTGVKVYPVPGNHDMATSDAIRLWQSTFVELPDNGPAGLEKLYWSFDAGPVHLVGVSTETPGAEHLVDLDWLEDDLGGSDAEITLVFGHAPAFPISNYLDYLDFYPEARDAFWQLLSDHGVSAYFCGHEHVYDHWFGDGVHQIITGGAAGFTTFRHFLVIDADEKDITINVYQYDGELRDSYLLSDLTWVDQTDRSEAGRSFFETIPCISIFLCLTMAGWVSFAGLSKRGSNW